MALKKPAQANKNAATDSKDKFEKEDDATTGTTGEASVGSTTSAEAQAAAETAQALNTPKDDNIVDSGELRAELVPVDKTAVAAVRQPSAQALAVLQQIPKLDDLVGTVHNNINVDWNSLPQVQATNGNFKLKEGNGIILGDEIHFQLISTQDNYCISPGVDDDEATQYVRYSDDGITLKDGVTTVKEHLGLLKSLGYDKAQCTKRLVLVGAMTQCKKKPELVGDLFQIDIPPTSLAKFKTFKIQASWRAAKGKLDVENVLFVKATALPTSAKGRDWTVVSFESSDVKPE